MAGTTPAFLGKIVASRGDSLTASYNRFYAQRTQKSMAAVNKNFAALIQTMTGIAPDVLKQVLQPTLDLAQVYTPVDTGELVNSGRLRVTRTHQNPRVEIAFGGGAVNYAALVHEKNGILARTSHQIEIPANSHAGDTGRHARSLRKSLPHFVKAGITDGVN